jgi:acyl carrier protein
MSLTESALLDLIAKEALVERDTLVREASLADLGISSLDLISLLFELEERYGVVVEEAELSSMTTVGELTDFLIARIAGATVSP